MYYSSISTMKFTSAFSLLAYAIKVGKTQATCGACLPMPPVSKSFQTLRIYNITDPNWTAEQAMEEAANTIALTLAKMPGFQRYTAAATGDSRNVLYMNQFDTKEEAQAAQDATSDPSNSAHVHNANEGKLELFVSAVTEGYASFPQGSCFTESQVGKTLTSGLYTYQDPASVDIAEEFTLEQDWYNELYSQTPGFVMTYVSTNAPAGSDKSVWKIMESEADEAAYQALKAEANYQWTGPPSDLVISTVGTIGLDVLCSDATDVPVLPPAPATTATAKASKASSAKSSKT